MRQCRRGGRNSGPAELGTDGSSAFLTQARGGAKPGLALSRSASEAMGLSIEPLAPRAGFAHPTQPSAPARLRSSNEKEMLERLQKVAKMAKGPQPAVAKVAHAWSSSLRSSS